MWVLVPWLLLSLATRLLVSGQPLADSFRSERLDLGRVDRSSPSPSEVIRIGAYTDGRFQSEPDKPCRKSKQQSHGDTEQVICCAAPLTEIEGKTRSGALHSLRWRPAS